MTVEPSDPDFNPPYQATEMREIVDRIESETERAPDSVADTIEEFARAVVEGGTWTPDCMVTAELDLTARERITGTRTQDLTAMLFIGMSLGSALERDVPADTVLEDAWRGGAFRLPDE